MRKKVVFLPYDFDTALGINNEGSLVFGYNLEDIDQVDGANVFNGQDSVLWNNLRDTYADEIVAMYRQLRSTGILSYNNVETQFEEHQNKWPEMLFNEDAKYKYLDPLEDDNDATYLPMLQGSKAEQRKWWLFNRFRYMDSKFNAGDALTDYIQLRGYAKGNITITPYADIYPTIKYGSYLVQTRGTRNNTYELVCPLSDMNDTEIYIYSASALSSIGDISALKVGLADFSRATKLTEIKIGDSSTRYVNPNLKSLTLGNNTLLRTIDIRNCVNLGNDAQKTIDLSGCTGLEEVYFDGTSIAGLDLPNGGVLKKLHLPRTITYLTLRNHTGLTEFVCPDFSHITTLWLENPSPIIDTATIVRQMAAGSRIRLYNFHWEMETLSSVYLMFDRLDTMRGLDQNGNNTEKAQVYGTIHVTYATTFEISEINSRYSDVTITYDYIMPALIYKTTDGLTTLDIEPIQNGGNGTKLLPPEKEANVQYSYVPAGWSLTVNGTADQNALTNVQTDRTVYAVYNVITQTYPITFWRGVDDGNDVLTVANIPYGEVASYPSSNPTSVRGNTYSFVGWTPELATVTGPATYTAIFRAPVTITYKDWDDTTLLTETVKYNGTAINDPTPTRANTVQYIYSFSGWSSSINGTVDPRILGHVTEDRTIYAIYSAILQTYTIQFVKSSTDGGGILQTSIISYGSLPVYNGSEPTTTRSGFAFNGWIPNIVAVTGNATYTAKFRNANPITYQLLDGTIESYNNNMIETIGDFAFYSCTKLESIIVPAVTSVGIYAFYDCTSLTEINLPLVTSIGNDAFYGCTSLIEINLPTATSIGDAAFQICRKLIDVNLSLATSIGTNAFRNCTSLTEIDLPAVTSISDGVFYGCTKLIDVNLPLATSISANAFRDCSSLTEIDLSAVTSIGSGIFQNCTSLTEIDLPAVTSMGNSAFYGCTSLTEINLPSVTSTGSEAFRNCSLLTEIDLPAVTSIGYGAFRDCLSLTTLIIRTTSQVCTLSNTNAFNNANSAIIYVPDALLNDYKAATNWTTYASRIKGLSELPSM